MSRDFPVFGLVIESLGLFIFVTLYVPIKKSKSFQIEIRRLYTG